MRKSPLAALALLAAIATTAESACIYPSEPENLPLDGATATRDQMVEAMGKVKEFDADIAAYTACLHLELQAALADEALSEEEKVRRREMFVVRNDAAVDHAQQVADRFNEQVRAYNAANKQ